MALFCAAIRRDSISILKFPFLCKVQFFSYEMLFISRLKIIIIIYSFEFFTSALADALSLEFE